MISDSGSGFEGKDEILRVDLEKKTKENKSCQPSNTGKKRGQISYTCVSTYDSSSTTIIIDYDIDVDGDDTDEDAADTDWKSNVSEYCLSLFPSDYEFDKEYMVQLWIAEGFIPHGKSSKSLEDTGSAFFDALVSESVFQISCQHNAISPIRYKLNSSSALNKSLFVCNDAYCKINDPFTMNNSEKTLRVSLVNWVEPTIFKNLHCSHNLRTLLLLHSDSNTTHLQQLPHDFFLKLRHLRVLDLSRSNITELPLSFDILFELRYLNLSMTPIKSIPPSLSLFHKLQTLKLKNCLKLVSIPMDISKLRKLRHLDVDLPRLLATMPPELGRLTHLQTLPLFVVGQADGCSLTELQHMVNLRGSLAIFKLENVTNLHEAMLADLESKDLDKLELLWGHMQDSFDLLEVLRPCINLKELKIIRYGGATFPKWIGDPLNELQTVSLLQCRNCELLPPLGRLQFLKCLELFEMHSVKAIDAQFCGRSKRVKSMGLALKTATRPFSKGNRFEGFPRLEQLTLSGMPSLEKWSGIKEGDFSLLQMLHITGCSKLTALPKLSLFKSLKELEISLCPLLKSIPKKGLPASLKTLYITGCPLLKDRCHPEGQDWDKIAHIPDISVD